MSEKAIAKPSAFVRFFWLMQRVTPAKSAFFKFFYNALMRRLPADEVTFLNYGYIDPSRKDAAAMSKDGDKEALQRGLYDRVLSNISLAGKDVLEVGCGRGGGAAYLASTRQPARIEGVDLSPEQVAFCQGRHRFENLSFGCANAIALPYPSDSFDVVLNVESSHCYQSVQDFYREAFRVLRSGGYFLYADFNPYGSKDIPENPIENLARRLKEEGFSLVEAVDITKGVLAALDVADEEKRHLIERATTLSFMRKNLADFAALRGSTVYDKFLTGESTYFAFVAQKPG
ncbi:hypothetical protein CAI21_06785 [Alkalilimnicola ehrlichii]|uniref:Methyltransferase type 11 domain-containing protein n=1 Tax=Alkalilimnicola ehrlichii TaxID=351052 RepID=A0A3E0X138_9GAMM|nr:class I SAM-dependent methyltransferase [Alkalilimnicola ehrlichii]RFA30310.1 hypothetical protein CAI21_06785 [Alkalilimnicola ehrlichii]RFA37887.1 hypothetical protein CAL65_08130 [Alkalilimnicola ehrlichii]